MKTFRRPGNEPSPQSNVSYHTIHETVEDVQLFSKEANYLAIECGAAAFAYPLRSNDDDVKPCTYKFVDIHRLAYIDNVTIAMYTTYRSTFCYILLTFGRDDVSIFFKFTSYYFLRECSRAVGYVKSFLTTIYCVKLCVIIMNLKETCISERYCGRTCE